MTEPPEKGQKGGWIFALIISRSGDARPFVAGITGMEVHGRRHRLVVRCHCVPGVRGEV
jgi:hypothetical protein